MAKILDIEKRELRQEVENLQRELDEAWEIVHRLTTKCREQSKVIRQSQNTRRPVPLGARTQQRGTTGT